MHLHISQLEEFKKNPVWLEIVAEIEREISMIIADLENSPKEQMVIGDKLIHSTEFHQGKLVAIRRIHELPDIMIEELEIDAKNLEGARDEQED